jgi:hypothetical protein
MVDKKIRIKWKVKEGIPIQKAEGIIVGHDRTGYRVRITRSSSALFLVGRVYVIPEIYMEVC